MSLFSKFKEKRAERQLHKLRDMSDLIVDDIVKRTNRGQLDPPGKKSVSRIPVNIIPFKPIKKKAEARDRELMLNGIYLNKYNLGELYEAYTRESYVKIAVDKYIEGVVKRGFHYESKTQLAVDYLRKRTREMGIASKKDINAIIRDEVFSLVLFGNVFKVKVRDSNKSSGLSHMWNGRKVKPIAGWYVADPRRVIIQAKNDGGLQYLIMPAKVKSLRVVASQVASYLRNLPSLVYSVFTSGYGVREALGKYGLLSNTNVITLDEEDVEHIRYHHTPGEKWAMPPFWPTLDDINLLRSIETAVDLLIYQFGSLLIHVKVSNPIQSMVNAALKKPPDHADIQEVKNKLEKMEQNGFIVTGDHVEMEVLQVAGNILRLEEYLQYAKQRVFSGLWLSPIAVGEGGQGGIARSVADTINDEKTGKIIELQSIIASGMNNLFIELLLEAGLSYAQALRANVVPRLVFDDVDIALKLKKQDSAVRLFEAGLLTEQECRKQLGMDDLTDEEREYTYPRLVKEYLIRAEQDAKAQALMAGALVAASKRAKSRKTPASRKAANNITPQNQHGKKFSSKKPVNK